MLMTLSGHLSAPSYHLLSELKASTVACLFRQFTITVMCCPGTRNTNPDALSWVFDAEESPPLIIYILHVQHLADAE